MQLVSQSHAGSLEVTPTLGIRTLDHHVDVARRDAAPSGDPHVLVPLVAGLEHSAEQEFAGECDPPPKQTGVAGERGEDVESLGPRASADEHIRERVVTLAFRDGSIRGVNSS